jgi:hypothetical protein
VDELAYGFVTLAVKVAVALLTGQSAPERWHCHFGIAADY